MQGQTLNPTTVGSGTVASFLALHGLVTVTSTSSDPAVICNEQPFHWNGTELVICSIGAVSWPQLEAVSVEVSLVAGTLRFHFGGSGSTDHVNGIAPEYREQLVTYLGPQRGHEMADEVGPSGHTYRLFITPEWRSESADR